MTFWQTIQDALGTLLGFEIGVIDTGTLVVGMFAFMMLFVLGALLIAMGAFALNSNTHVPWMATFAVGSTAIMALLWVLIPGWPLMSTLGFFLGIVGVVAAYIIHRQGVDPATGSHVALIAGIIDMILAVVAIAVELYGGGGFLA